MAADLTLLCLPGDGIGPEIMSATQQVVRAAFARTGRRIALPEAVIGFPALRAEGTTIPQPVIDAAMAADGVILGPVSHNAYPPVAEGGRNPSGVLRKAMELYANIRPAVSHPLVPTPTGQPVDLVVVRENLEGFYADRNMFAGNGEFMPVPGVALSVRRITEANSRAIARAGFAIAARRPRRKVTVIHKANVLRMSDGLFLDCARDEARAFPDVEVEEMLIDAAAAHMVRDPGRFDVVIATNMYGDILSDLASELAGGLGLGSSLNHGATHAVAQAQHGSAPDIAGQDRANPSSLIKSVSLLLAHRGARTEAALIDAAIATALERPETRTRDLGGQVGTRAFADIVSMLIEESPR